MANNEKKSKFTLGSMDARRARYLGEDNVVGEGKGLRQGVNKKTGETYVTLSAKGHSLMAKGYYEDAMKETNPDKRAFLFKLAKEERILASTQRALGAYKEGDMERMAGEVQDLNRDTLRQQTGRGYSTHKGNKVLHTYLHEKWQFENDQPNDVKKGIDPYASNYKYGGYGNNPVPAPNPDASRYQQRVVCYVNPATGQLIGTDGSVYEAKDKKAKK